MQENNQDQSKVVVSFRTSLLTRDKLVELGKKQNEKLSDTVNRVVNAYFQILEDMRNKEAKE